MERARSADMQEEVAAARLEAPREAERRREERAYSARVTQAYSDSLALTRLDNETDHWLDRMGAAGVAFNRPERMYVGDTRGVEVILGPGLTLDSVAALLTEPGRVTTRAVRVSPTMVASLRGADFEVRAVTPETVAVSGREPTAWGWDITAKREGEAQRLTLSIVALVSVEGARNPRPMVVLTETIPVEVRRMQQVGRWIDDNKAWLWGALLVPLGGLVIGWWRRRKAPSG